MGYKIVTDNIEKYIDQVQMLGDQNRKTLGFFPEGAFQEYMEKRQVFCAIEDERVIAYIMFRYIYSRNCITLIHVCVDPYKRKTGVASELIESVVHNNQNVSYIEARCRRDYHLDEFWQSCGFHIRTEKDGRKLNGSDLTIWQRKLFGNDILDIILQEERKDRFFAALDLNVIVQLCDKKDSTDQCLLDSKISEDVKYCVTPECLKEINKKEDVSVRRRHLQYASKFLTIHDEIIDDNLLKNLTNDLDPQKTHQSDIKHLAYCVVSSLSDAFITNDKWINNQREYFLKRYNLMIFYPEEFFSYIFHSDEYSVDRRITGSKYQIKKLDNSTIYDVYDLYAAVNMKKNKWQAEIRENIIDDNINTWLLYDYSSIIGLISIKNETNYYSINHFIITVNCERRIYRYLTMSLLSQPIHYLSQKKGINLICLSNSYEESLLRVAYECGFISTTDKAIKIIASGAYKKDDLLKAIYDFLSETRFLPDGEKSINIIKQYISEIAKSQDYTLEKVLGPTIIINLQIPTYIISIKPKYAVDLFDDNLSYMNQSYLDNTHVYAALSMTNAYYTSSSIKFNPPCRIIWYVTCNERYTGSGSVRASSIMTYHKRGTPREVYKEFSQLGVLEWKSICELKNIGIFLFDSTISFSHPICLDDLQKMALTTQRKKMQLQGPMHIKNELAAKILEKAMGDNSCII